MCKKVTLHETGESRHLDITFTRRIGTPHGPSPLWHICQGENQGVFILSEKDIHRLVHTLNHLGTLTGELF